MTSDEARIAARYPKANPTDYLIGILAGLAVLTAIVLVILAGVRNANPPVAAAIRGFEVPSASEITAEIVVQRTDPTDAVECLLYAQASSYEKVAEHVMEVPPGTEKLTVVNISLKTIKEATAIRLDGCRVVG